MGNIEIKVCRKEMKGENMKKYQKRFKRFIAILLTLTLLIGSIPMTEWRVMAEQLESMEETESVIEELTEAKETKDVTKAEAEVNVEKSTPASESADNTAVEGSESDTIDSDACGENVSWVLSDDGVLTIFGTGDMFNYDKGKLRGIVKAMGFIKLSLVMA